MNTGLLYEIGKIMETRLFRTLGIFFIAFTLLTVWAVNRISASMSVNVSTPPAQVTTGPSVQAGYQVISLGNGMIGIIDEHDASGSTYQKLMVFQFDSKTHKFNPVGVFDYSQYIHNPLSLETLNVNK